MTRYEIIQIDEGTSTTWARLKDAHEVVNVIPYFMKTNHPDTFFLVDNSRDKMFPIPYVSAKLKEWGAEL